MVKNMNHVTLVISIVLAAVLVAGIYATSVRAAFAAHETRKNIIQLLIEPVMKIRVLL